MSEGAHRGGESPDFDFEKAVQAIRKAAEVLAKPEAKATLEAIQDAVKAVAAIQDAVKAVAVQDVVKAVAVQDAVKAVAVQDVVKAVAAQDAVKAVVLQDAVRAAVAPAVSQEVARALEVIKAVNAEADPNKKGKP